MTELKPSRAQSGSPITPTWAKGSREDFDFDLWAAAVRQQMIEALRKRGER